MIRYNNILSSGLHFSHFTCKLGWHQPSVRHGNAWMRSHMHKSTRFHRDITIPERISVRLINLNVLYSSVMRVVILASPVMMAGAVSSLSRHLWRYVCTCRFQLRAHYVSNSLINYSCHVTLALHHEPLAHSEVVSGGHIKLLLFLDTWGLWEMNWFVMRTLLEINSCYKRR